jgi:hypothetical protein
MLTNGLKHLVSRSLREALLSGLSTAKNFLDRFIVATANEETLIRAINFVIVQE